MTSFANKIKELKQGLDAKGSGNAKGPVYRAEAPYAGRTKKLEKAKNQPSKAVSKSKTWSFDRRTLILRNERSGAEYLPSKYRRVEGGIAGFEIIGSKDAWAGDLEIAFHD